MWLSESKEKRWARCWADRVRCPRRIRQRNNCRACTELSGNNASRNWDWSASELFRPEAGGAREGLFRPSPGELGSGGREGYFQRAFDVRDAQSVEQFRPMRKGIFVGRGSCDMKGGDRCDALRDAGDPGCGVELNGRIGLMLVPDEETGGKRGSGRLARGGREGLLGGKAEWGCCWQRADQRPWCGTRIAGRISCARCWDKSAQLEIAASGGQTRLRDHRGSRGCKNRSARWSRVARADRLGEQGAIRFLMLGGQSGGGTQLMSVQESAGYTVDRRIKPEENLVEEKAKCSARWKNCKQMGIPLDWEGNLSRRRLRHERGRRARQALSP